MSNIPQSQTRIPIEGVPIYSDLPAWAKSAEADEAFTRAGQAIADHIDQQIYSELLQQPIHRGVPTDQIHAQMESPFRGSRASFYHDEVPPITRAPLQWAKAHLSPHRTYDDWLFNRAHKQTIDPPVQTIDPPVQLIRLNKDHRLQGRDKKVHHLNEGDVLRLTYIHGKPHLNQKRITPNDLIFLPNPVNVKLEGSFRSEITSLRLKAGLTYQYRFNATDVSVILPTGEVVEIGLKTFFSAARLP